MPERESKQLLHLVFGGEVVAPGSVEFRDISKLDVVGIYPNYNEAYSAWRAAALLRWTEICSTAHSLPCTYI